MDMYKRLPFESAFSQNLVYYTPGTCTIPNFVISGFYQRQFKEPKFKNWVYSEQITAKSTQNWVVFYHNILMDNWQKIGTGIEKVKCSTFGRQIHIYDLSRHGAPWIYLVEVLNPLLPPPPPPPASSDMKQIGSTSHTGTGQEHCHWFTWYE